MNVNVQSVTRPVFRAGLVLKKHAPTIAFVGGVAGTLTSTVMACRATLKLAEQLPEMKEEMDDVRAMNEKTGGENRKDVAYIYSKNAMTVVQLYAPSVIIGVASITALTGSHIAMNRRNAGLTAAYAAVSKAYDDYRDRVRDELGESREVELYRGIDVKKIKGEDGKKHPVPLVDPNATSVYARFFDEYSTEWQKNAEMNKIFLKCQQEYFNHRLQVHGHVFLNEVYDNLGLERSQAGSVVGWVLSEDGDNYIDFGMFETRDTRFVNNLEWSILLDFNVDGVIWDKI